MIRIALGNQSQKWTPYQWAMKRKWRLSLAIFMQILVSIETSWLLFLKIWALALSRHPGHWKITAWVPVTILHPTSNWMKHCSIQQFHRSKANEGLQKISSSRQDHLQTYNSSKNDRHSWKKKCSEPPKMGGLGNSTIFISISQGLTWLTTI